MAKIVISIEDKSNGTVEIICSPPFEEIAKRINSGGDATSAEGYGLFALRMIREEAKRKAPSTTILIPRIGKQ